MKTTITFIEKQKQKLQQLEKRMQNQKNKLKTQTHKKKIHTLMELGKLVEKAQIDHLSSDELLGAFCEIKELSKKEDQRNLWTETAKKLFKEIKKDQTPLIISFISPSDPNQQTKDLLKQQKFKWNAFRKEWHGYGDSEKLKTLLKNTSAKIEPVE